MKTVVLSPILFSRKPRLRRSGMMAVVMSVAALGAAGCGGTGGADSASRNTQGQAEKIELAFKPLPPATYCYPERGAYYMEKAAAEAFARADAALHKATGHHMIVTSAYRTEKRQAELLQALQGTQAVSDPGKSTHGWRRGGGGVDVLNYISGRPYLEAEGFHWGNLPNDPYHYTYNGPDKKYAEETPAGHPQTTPFARPKLEDTLKDYGPHRKGSGKCKNL